jgi:hypothetical protein
MPKRRHRQSRGDLLALGYAFHTAPRTTREGRRVRSKPGWRASAAAVPAG